MAPSIFQIEVHAQLIWYWPGARQSKAWTASCHGRALRQHPLDRQCSYDQSGSSFCWSQCRCNPAGVLLRGDRSSALRFDSIMWQHRAGHRKTRGTLELPAFTHSERKRRLCCAWLPIERNTSSSSIRVEDMRFRGPSRGSITARKSIGACAPPDASRRPGDCAADSGRLPATSER